MTPVLEASATTSEVFVRIKAAKFSRTWRLLFLDPHNVAGMRLFDFAMRIYRNKTAANVGKQGATWLN
jgi:hypothetical protein